METYGFLDHRVKVGETIYLMNLDVAWVGHGSLELGSQFPHFIWIGEKLIQATGKSVSYSTISIPSTVLPCFSSKSLIRLIKHTGCAFACEYY
jgi:hypothetical protein